jgi:3-hydroxyisobutyrate dehydrogenase-like beta-hydroxyacid dehydrogenase
VSDRAGGPAETIAVIGLGAMGGAMATNLAARGHRVVGFDIDTAAVERAEAVGIQGASTIAEALADVRYAVTSLPNPAIVREAWLGQDGVVAAGRSGTVILEMSSIDPATMVEIGEAGRQAGLRVLDCPVSGGPGEAINGTLTLLVGGAPADFDDARAVLAELGADAQYTGDLGTGKVVKIVNNLMAMGNVAVAAEAFTLGVSAGVEPQRLFDVLSVSGGRSHHLLKRFPKALVGNFAPGFKLLLGEKDLGLGLELARSFGLPTPIAGAVRQLFEIAMSQGLDQEDVVALVKLYRGWAGADPLEPLAPQPHSPGIGQQEGNGNG